MLRWSASGSSVKDCDDGVFIAIDLAGCKISVARYADIFQPLSRDAFHWPKGLRMRSSIRRLNDDARALEVVQS